MLSGMWTCGRCGESVEDSFSACWKCGTSSEGVPNPGFRPVDQPTGIAREPLSKDADPLACPRCSCALEYVGRKRFHEGTNWGALGEIGELFVKREHFDVYVCPRCGRVEFFVDGIGEQFRPQ